ncbi:hypothetical protein B0H19DRAFT_1134831 [Mycena capillaripes]|nr:hypothetical protein B0H19DRAFT_1134831 [Mycena capillaripes]
MHLLLQGLILAAVPLVTTNYGLCNTHCSSSTPRHSGPRKTNILNSDVDAAIESVLKNFNSPGVVGVAVARKYRDGSHWEVETKGYGIAKADGTKATNETLFAIGCNSKLFDILATELLISNESLSTRISWDTKIASFVPEWERELMNPVASAESTIISGFHEPSQWFILVSSKQTLTCTSCRFTSS